MKFKTEDDFLKHCFKNNETVEVNAVELQNKLIESNAKEREIAKLNRKVIDLNIRNNFLYTRLEEEKNRNKSTYSLDLSA